MYYLIFKIYNISCIKFTALFTRYSGCHKYVPFAGFSNRRKYNV